MTARHLVPTPWRVEEGRIVDKNGGVIAYIAARLNLLDDYWREIANEFAAAHEMREALDAMYACLNNRILGIGGNPSDDHALWAECVKACDAARNALAKADAP